MCKSLCCKRLVDFLTRHSSAYMQVNQKPRNQGGGANSAMEQCMQVDSSVMTHQHVIEASFTNGLAALCGWVTCLCHRIRSTVKRAIELGTLGLLCTGPCSDQTAQGLLTLWPANRGLAKSGPRQLPNGCLRRMAAAFVCFLTTVAPCPA